MRNLKKIGAIVLALAMILNLGIAYAFDAENPLAPILTVTDLQGNPVSSVKAGTDVYVNFALPNGTYENFTLTPSIPDAVIANNETIAPEWVMTGGSPSNISWNSISKKLFASHEQAGQTLEATDILFRVKLNVGTTEGEVTLALFDSIYDVAATVGDDVVAEEATAVGTPAKVTVSAPWDIAQQVAVTKTVDFGTADPALDTTITVKNADGSKSEAREVEWDLVNDYSATTVGAQTISGTIKADDNKLGVIGDFVAEATVTVNPVAKAVSEIQGMIDANTYTIMLADDLTADDAAAVLPPEIELSVEVGEEIITDTVAVAWTAVAPETFAVNGEFTATGTLSTPSEVETLAADTVVATKNGIFAITGDTVTANVTITPAEVTGSSIDVEMKGYTQKPEVTVTLPAGTLVAGGTEEEPVYPTINVTFTAGEGESAVTKTVSYTVKPEEIAANEEGEVAITVKADNYLKAYGFQVGDTITVTADVDGAAILSGETDGEEQPTEVPESFVVKSVITGGGSQVGGAGATGAVKNYLINVAEATNGTVAVSKDNAAKGTVITVTTTPAEGYKTEKITVKDKDGIDIPVDQDAKTFTMPGKDVTVSATFVEGEEVVAPVETTYTDVTAEHWAYEAIEALAAAGIVNGNPDGTFAPDNAITRAELTKMIVNVFGVEAASLETGFVDCPADAWFTPYVAAAKEAGYVTGVSETEFAPEALVTREQACAILGRALNATSETALTFTDAADIEAYAAPYVAALVDLGIVNGYADGSFAPANSITRAEAAKIIAGAMAIIEVVEAPVEEATEEVTEEATEEAAEETTEEATEETTEEVTEEATEEAAEEVTEEATEEAAEETTEEVTAE